MISSYKYFSDKNISDINFTNPNPIIVPSPENNILGKVIDTLNNTPFAQTHFSFLKYVSLDFGHLVVFFSIFLLTLSFILLINNNFLKRMEKSIEKRIKDKKDLEILIKSFTSIKKPVAFILILTGLYSALFTLYYPNSISLNLYNVFEFLFTILTIWISLLCVEIFFFAFFEKTDDISIRKELMNIFIKLIKFTIVISGILFYLTKLGVSLAGIVASVGILGMAFVLASKDTISNFFGSLNILMDNSISNGDWIQSKDVEGTVVELGARTTKIRTYSNALVTVPNSVLAANPLTNWSKRKVGRRIKIKIGLSFKSKPENIEKVLKELRDMVSLQEGIAKDDYSFDEADDNYLTKLISQDDMYGIKNKKLVFLDAPGDTSLNIVIYVYSESTEWEDWTSLKEILTLKSLKIISKHKLEIVNSAKEED